MRRPFLLLALPFLAAAGCRSSDDSPETVRGTVMGTAWSVSFHRGSLKPSAAWAETQRVLDRVDRRMSTYKPESEISRFNASRDLAPFPVSEETARVAEAALGHARQSRGVFDPTVSPLVSLWGFGPEKRRNSPPSSEKIQTALMKIGFKKVTASIHPPALEKEHPETELDLSAIAKGYAVDAAAIRLQELGLKDFLIEVGGEMLAKGTAPGGRPWRVGIDLPREGSLPGEALAEAIPLKNQGLATSGSYRNAFRHGGRFYSHFIDPRTGQTARSTLLSASVLAPTAMEADAVATLLMLLGPEAAKREIQNRPGLEALLIKSAPNSTYRLWRSPAWPKPSN